MYFLMWLDTDPKKTEARKMEEARARYREKFGTEPAEVLVKGVGLYWLGPIEAGQKGAG